VIGAEILGADLRNPISPDVAEDIRQALWANGVVFFRDQPIDYDGHLRLAQVFGEPEPEVGQDPERPPLLVMRVQTGERAGASGHWHSDGTWSKLPSLVSILRAVKAPLLGGDTWFSSAIAAYRNLPDDIKTRIAPLRARASVAYGMRHVTTEEEKKKVDAVREAFPPVDHPVVRLHPVTGVPAIYVNENHTCDIVGMENDEGMTLLNYLTSQFRRPEYQVAWQWRDDSIAIWDNAAVQHYAVPGQLGFRHVERIRVWGTPPVGITERAPKAAE
jgi:taurine dioxygenase